jgi:hypothetical protein
LTVLRSENPVGIDSCIAAAFAYTLRRDGLSRMGYGMGLARSALATTLVMVLSGGAAVAAEPPQLLPTRDVDIVYRITRPQQPKINEHVRWSAAQHRERVEGPDGSATIFDRDNHEITLISPKTRTYRQLEGEPREPVEPDKDAVLTRGGESKVAGLACTDWSWVDDGGTHTVCATPDGVVLRLAVNGKIRVEARSVTYRKQKPDLFEVPPGYSPALAPEGSADP